MGLPFNLTRTQQGHAITIPYFVGVEVQFKDLAMVPQLESGRAGRQRPPSGLQCPLTANITPLALRRKDLLTDMERDAQTRTWALRSWK